MDGVTPVSNGRSERLPTVAGYMGVLRSHRGAIIVLMLAGILAGGVLASLKAPSFKATAAIELPDVPSYVDVDPQPPAPSRTTIDTTAQLVQSEPVYRAVIAATGLSEKAVREGLGVSAYPLSRVLIVSFTARTSSAAVAGAQAASQQLVQERATVLPGAQLDDAMHLRARLQHLQAESRREVREFSPQTQELGYLLLQIEQARQAGAAAGGTIVDRAESARRVNAHPELQIVTGAVLGILLGIGYAWWRRDKHLHDDPRVIGLAAKVRPRRRSARRSRRPGLVSRRHSFRSHGS
jgi:hypothetical protein